MNIRFSSKQNFHIAGWSAYLSAAAMIISIVLTSIVFSQGTVVLGTGTHNALIEVFDVSAALFFDPVAHRPSPLLSNHCSHSESLGHADRCGCGRGWHDIESPLRF